MKKVGIFCFVMAAMATVCVTSCSKDDDGNKDSGKSNIETPKYADQACTITPAEGIALSNGDKINTIDLSESGKVYLEKKNPDGKTIIVNGTYTVNNNVYTCKGKNFSGTIETEITRATQNLKVKVNITFIDEDGNQVTPTVQDFVEAIKETSTPTGDGDIVSTWKVRGLSVEVTGKDSKNAGFKDFPSGDLNEIVKEAEAQGATLTDEEKADLNKTLEAVTFRSDKVTFDYNTGESDVAKWNWTNTNTCDEINIKFDAGMGNKFMVNDPSVSVEFNKEKKYMNITLDAKLQGSKDLNACLVIYLVQQAEVK